MTDTAPQQTSTTQNTGPSMSPLLMLGVVVILGVVGVGVVTSQSQKTTTPSPSPAADTMMTNDANPPAATSVPTGAPATTDAMGVRTISLEAGSFYYKPAEIRIKKGETVKLVMNSVDMMHDFNIDELGVKIPITKAGATASVEFTPTKVGQFEYYCSVGQHRQNGQVGTLIVEE